MNNYIKFYYQGNRFIAEIHKQGKYKIVSNEEDLSKLIDICKYKGHIIRNECILSENFFTITRLFDEYLKSKNKSIKVIGDILPNMILSKKNMPFGKTFVTISLALVLASSGLTAFSNENGYASADTTSETNYEQITDIEMDNDLSNNEEELVAASYPENNQDLENMLQSDEYHYSYEDRTNAENITNAHRYEDLFEEYGNMYGVDKNLLMALAAQESCGEHYESLDSGPAEGIMQIEKAVHIASTVAAYNVETEELDYIEITPENLQDLETNIRIGTMLLRNCLEENNYNIPLALQTYNFGPGNMYTVLSTCSELENIDEDELLQNPTNTSWLDYREFLNTGDCQYIEHVFSFLPSDTTITVKDRDNNNISITIFNDYQNTNSL